MNETSWLSYLRSDGRKGIRNVLLVIYTVECASDVAQAVARDELDAHVIGFPGCYDNAYAIRLLLALARHPNVGAVLSIGLGCEYIRSASIAAQLYQKSLTAMDAKLLAYCWLLLDPEQPTFDQTRSLLILDRSDSFRPKPAGYTFRTFTAFSRRLPEGMLRVDATSDDPDIRVSAFVTPGLGQTMIMLNQSTAPKRVTWTGLKSAFSVLEVVDQYHANSVESALKLDHVTIPPGAIFTLTTVKLRAGGR